MKPILFSNKRKFFYDCEFIESNLRLISIGVVGENPGQEIYFCNSDAIPEFKNADPWIKDNVLPQLPEYGTPAWKSEGEIRDQLLMFLDPSEEKPVEMWGYYADYDHILLCKLFGRMVNLPVGIPKYTLDVQQLAYHMGDASLPGQSGARHIALEDARYVKRCYDYLRNLDRFDL